MLLKPTLRYLFCNNIAIFILYIICIAFSLAKRSNTDAWILYSLLFSIAFISLYFTLVWLRLQMTNWEITESQVIYKRGIFSVQTDYIELYRVCDYVITQTLLERIFAIKQIVLLTSDKTHPELKIFGINNSSNAIEIIRQNVEQARKTNNIYEIANR